MLKVLKLRAALAAKKNELVVLKERQADFKKRRDEIETSLEEAKTPDEQELIQNSIDELEADIKKEFDGKEPDDVVNGVQGEIEKIEGELAELEKPAPTDPTLAPTPAPTENQRGGNFKMKTRGLFYSLSENERHEMVQREDVKDFLTRCREFKGKTRSVTGAELEIPDVFLGLIKDNLNKYSKLINVVNLKPVGGEARQTISGTIPEAIWTEMIANLNELNLTFNQIEVDGYKVGGYIAVANSILDDTDIALAAEILEALAQSIGLACDKAILFGTGKRMPLGIATRLAQTAQPADWGANAPAWTDLHTSNIIKWNASTQSGAEFFAELILKLGVCKSKYSNGEKFWVMNEKTKSKIMAKSVAFNAAATLTASVNDTMPIIGGKIITLDFVADDDIIGGYGSLYLFAERAGSSFASSDIPKFLQDQTVFKGTARYDGMPVFGEGFVIINIANTNPTTTVTFAGDEANTDLVSLSALTIGTTPVTLYPPFSKDVLNYHCKVSAHSNKITATALKNEANVVIKNGATSVNSGSNATFTAGENVLSVEVTNGNAVKRTYTVVVEDVTA